jgi:hypothetical protein
MAGRRDGFALPLMLGILAVCSILVAGAFLMARLEAQSGENGLTAARAMEVAESGLSEIVGWWDPVLYNQLSPGDTLTLPARSLGAGGYTGMLTRLSAALFLVESKGWHGASANLPQARRSLRRLVRLIPEMPVVSGALTVIDSLVWDTASRANGYDTIPPGWGGCSPDSAVAGVVFPPAAVVDLAGCLGCQTGIPPLRADSTVGVVTLSAFGPAGYAGLAARATLSPSGVIGGISPQVGGMPVQCLLADSLNWGEPHKSGPFAACGGYYPVIHSPGNLTLTGGRGQGILLVDGDLEVGGGFEFHGLVIVLGTVRNGPGGGTIIGALLARTVVLTRSAPVSQVAIRYSACVLPNATVGSSRAIPLLYRSWAQSF